MREKIKKIIKLGLSSLVILLVMGFVVFGSRNIVLGPQIKIETPTNGKTAESSLVEIRGFAKNISEIKMNGRNIFIDEDGKFKEKMLLSYGYNTIVIEGRDRFGRKEIKKLELVYK